MKLRPSLIFACLTPLVVHATTLAPPAKDTGITIKVGEPVNEVIDDKRYSKFDITMTNTSEKVAWIGTKKDAELDKLILKHNPKSIAYSIWHGAGPYSITEVLHRGKKGWESALTLESDFIGLPAMTYAKFDTGVAIQFAVMVDHHQFSQPGTMHFAFHFSWDQPGRKDFYQVSRRLRSPNMLDIAPKEPAAHVAWAKKAEARGERLKRLESFWEKYSPEFYPRIEDEELRSSLFECAWDLTGSYLDAGRKHQARQVLSWLRRYDSKSTEQLRKLPTPNKPLRQTDK